MVESICQKAKLSSEWKTEVVTDSGDGGEGGGDELPCATKGKGGEDCVW